MTLIPVPSRGARRAVRFLMLSTVFALAPRLARAASTELDEPVPWQDAGRMALPFLQLPFESPRTLAPGGFAASVRTFYTSNVGRGESDRLLVDFSTETVQPTVVLRWGLRPGLELHLEAPLVIDQGGFLGGTVKAVEGIFGPPNPLRAGPQPHRALIRLTRPDGRMVLERGNDLALGDVWGGVKARVLEQDGLVPATALRLALKLPTGRFPYGSGALEVGAGVLAHWRAGRTNVFAAADLSIPGGAVSSLRLGTRPHPAFQLGVSQDLSARVALALQMSAHGPAYRAVGAQALDAWSFYLLGGVRARVGRSLFVDFAVVENLFDAQAGADISSVLDVEGRW